MVLGEESLAVGVDIFPFFERMTGVGWYEWNLLARLPEVDPQVELRFYAHTFAAPDEPSPPPLPTTLRSRFRFHHMPQGFLLPIGPTMRLLRADRRAGPAVPRRQRRLLRPQLLRAAAPPGRGAVAGCRPFTTSAFLRLPHTVQRETLDNLHRHLPGALFAPTR